MVASLEHWRSKVSWTSALMALSFTLPAAALRAETYSPDQIIARSVTHNPEILALVSRQESMAEKARSASYWSDPMISVNYFPKPLETRLGAQEANFMVSQGIPWPGKNAARKDELSQTAKAISYEIAAKRLMISAEITSLIWSLSSEQKNLLINQKERAFLADLTTVALSKVRVGSGSQQDVTATTLELSLLEERKRLLGEKIRSTTAKIATLADLSSDITISVPEQMTPEKRFSDPDGWKKLLSEGQTDHPELLAAQARSAAADSAVKTSKLSAAPEIRATASYIFIDEQSAMSPSKDNEDAYSVGLSFSIPLWYGKYSAATSGAIATKAAADWDIHKVRLQIKNDLADLWQQAATSEELIGIYDSTILPQAEQVLLSNLSAYQQGAATL